jgi:hypothetical protein
MSNGDSPALVGTLAAFLGTFPAMVDLVSFAFIGTGVAHFRGQAAQIGGEV